MWRNIASNFLSIAVLLLVVLAGVLAWAQRQYVGQGPLEQAICYKVPSGAKLWQVAEGLEEKGAVTSAYIFKVGADYEGRAAGLKAGSYLLTPGASMQEIVAIVAGTGRSTCGTEINYRIGVASVDVIVRELDAVANRYVERVKFDPATEAVPQDYVDVAEDADTRIRITLAEGVTSWQVVEALKRADFLAGDAGDVPAEGYLKPDSYEIRRGAARGEVLADMEARQRAVIDRLWAERASDLPYDTPEEALVMASIVEKETGVPEERPIVASVFVNRLRQGMRLQTDPTVIYGLTGGKGTLGRGIRQSELKKETPYNTYVIEGLPPTPIANPGEDSIHAALNPAQTDFLFFVADGSGGHVFAETLDEHNRNVAKWREIEAQQKATEGSGN
ncbi:endolytic transglycosylase MltG [Albidovulum sp.]|uniref:endolytic transglycosylase MltG n=1 Tax=Albidovulum sp. TaxID=1872424 RepID=UPI001D9EB229|nr:endolytic transglycosylase MltG [Paracoccaceae bacterium]MCC0046854.1 endolytic transglycosylase MltG [Defluviimonas sp.]HPE26263.1 endolytic transglycosylase MltG [Albidovulum sp.]MCB2118991.1 endolytic transglycosylase MltG [Paracoccaceae bacterium]MCB2122057.1 endolytic transglycosylase MltG [Paracoccaceae bacterium]